MWPSITHDLVFCAATTRRFRACEGGGPVSRAAGFSCRALERQRLGAAVDLGAAVGVERVDRGAREGRVGGEEPAEGLFVGETAVEQDRERPAQALDDLVAVEEGRRDGPITARPGDGEQLAVAEQLLDATDGQVEPGGHFGE